MDPLSSTFTDQDVVFEELGLDLLDNAFQGYNACIFAYGQTGSGKSYTMMGSIEKDPGIIPRLCHELFSRILSNNNDAIQFKVEMSYMEIYNEKVHDLLDPRASRKSNLKVREHKILGPYVDGLSRLAVTSGEDIYELIEIGNRSRTVAATNMNAESSRSHAVFTIVLSQQITNFANKMTGEKVSRISLVDLAGSERATKTGAAGDRLKEGSNINKSLTTLGLVISALAEQSSNPNRKRQIFVPYRDSTLTWLLKDSLGGNSKTVMIATISPAADNYDETISSLRYADRAKRIVNNAVINEDPNAKIIRELREEIEMLKRQLADALNASKRHKSSIGASNTSAFLPPNMGPGGWSGRDASGSGDGYSDDSDNEDSVAKALLDQLAESERLVQQMSLTWEEKVVLSEAITKDRQGALNNMGLKRLGASDNSSTGSLDELGAVGGLGTGGGRRKTPRNKIYIINLHSDPLLNEMLMYPLKKYTTVGREDNESPPDIHLTGLGMHKRHCVFEIRDNDVHLIPTQGARTCVNGEEIGGETVLKHCDRILFGNNHIFRINCPATNRSQAMGLNQGVDTSKFDYEFARTELMENSIASESVAQMMSKLESALCGGGDKEDAVARQRALYERHISLLQGQLSPQQLAHINWENFNSLIGPSNQSYSDWIEKQDEAFKWGLRRLKESLTETLTLSKEAEGMAKEMDKKTTYKVTLQIPPYNLTPNRRLLTGSSSNGGLLCEPAVVVRRKGRPPCIWTLAKLDNRIVEMRDMYSEWKQDRNNSTDNLDKVEDEAAVNVCGTGNKADQAEGEVMSLYDPFFEVQDNHDLIGVANVFLECLFYDVTLSHHVPIINQQGEVSGKLKIEMSKVSGSLHGYRMADAGAASESQSESSSETDQSSAVFSSSEQPPDSPSATNSHSVTCKLKITDAQGLPPSTAHFVFCTFEFFGQEWEEPVTVVQKLDPERVQDDTDKSGGDIAFQYEGEFKLNVTEEFLEYCCEGSLAIEIYGHRKSKKGAGGDDANMTSQNSAEDSVASLHDSITQKNKHLIDKWNEVKSAIEMWVEIQEINDQGDFAPVDVLGKQDVPTGGVYQLKQGHTRHIKVMVNTPSTLAFDKEGRPAGGAGEGDLPLVVDSVVGVQIGGVTLVNKSQQPLDSFQDDDLTRLRSRWADALSRRKQHLEEQLKEINLKAEKDEVDVEREVVLLDQWVSLTEERNAVLVPAPGSSIPGAKSLWNPMPGMETSKTVLFLDLDPLEMMPVDGNVLGCGSSFLSKEVGSRFFPLTIIDRASDPEVSCTVTWDSSVHNEACLNKPTLGGDRIYLILKVFLHLSMPAPMDVVLRKRICCVIYKRPSITSVVRKKFFGTGLALTGVTFQVVSHIPQSSEDIETRESLALLAASSIEKEGYEGLEKYTQSLCSVESLLTFDRLKQEVAILEAMKKSGVSLRQQALDLPVFLPLLKVGSSCTGSEEDSRMGFVHDNASPMWSPASSMTSLNSLAMGTPMPDSPHLGLSAGGGPGGYRSRTGSFRRHSLTPSAMRRCTSWGYQNNKFGTVQFTRENSVKSLVGASMAEGDCDSMSQTRRGSRQTTGRKTNSPCGVGIGSSQTLRGVNSRGMLPSSGSVGMISERPEHRNSASFSLPGGNGPNSEYRRSVSSAIASAENLEHKPDESCDMSQELLLPVISVESDPGVNDQEPKSRRSSSPSRLMSTTDSVHSSPSTDTLGGSSGMTQGGSSEMNHRASRSSPHLLKVGGSTGGDFKTQRPQSPRVNPLRMTTLEEQEESISSPVTVGGDLPKKMEVCRSLSANTDDVISTLKESPQPEETTATENKQRARPLGEAGRGASADSIPQWVRPGVSVRVGPNKRGTVKYSGHTHFSEGVMVGVSLDSPHGRHDGSVDGVRYFQCLPNHGVFVKADRLEQITPNPPSASPSHRANTSSDQPNSFSGSSSNLTLRSTLAARKSAKALSERRKNVATSKGL